MKIGLFSSGVENLSLLKLLKQYDLEIVVYINQNAWPLEDKLLSEQEKYIQDALNFFEEKKVDKIILPAVWELKLKDNQKILPLYQNIVNQTLKYSLVGKIGLLGNQIDLDFVENYLKNLNYQATERQKSIKAFSCFKIYKKDVAFWKYSLILLGSRNWMMRKIIKFDLRYFFDAAVDSILPTSYAIYHFEKLIKNKKKKLRFQFMNSWEFTDDLFGDKNNNYKLKVFWQGNKDLFLKNKKWQVFIK